MKRTTQYVKAKTDWLVACPQACIVVSMDTSAERLIISHTSALELYRQLRASAEWVPGATPLTDAREMLAALPRPVHVLGETPPSHGLRHGLARHRCSTPASDDSICLVAPGVYATRPEVCLAQLSRGQEAALVVALAMEMCGTYARKACQDRTAYGLPPITSVSRLGDFVRDNPGRPGVNLIRRILPYVLDGSASPAETILHELISLPTCWGGAGLEAGASNYRVDIRGTSGLADQDEVVFDLCWPRHGIVVEYDGRRYHDGFPNIEHDAARRNAVVALGMSLYTITRAQLYDIGYIDRLCATLAKSIKSRGLRIQVQNYEEKRRHLHSILLNK